MEIEEMAEQDCRAMLARTHIARLACAQNNQPYVVPTCLYFDGGQALYCYTALGQKIEWMRRNPLVCLEMDEITTPRQWVSLIVFGHYEELPDAPEYAAAREVGLQLFEEHAAWWEPASVPLPGHERRARVAFRIHIAHMTGRRTMPRP
jgi:nitroimidazol reductase NimA-like FMN-containing flavoprotein (pyridoxamine 5'-phosphate oxidase superfamily)